MQGLINILVAGWICLKPALRTALCNPKIKEIILWWVKENLNCGFLGNIFFSSWRIFNQFVLWISHFMNKAKVLVFGKWSMLRFVYELAISLTSFEWAISIANNISCLSFYTSTKVIRNLVHSLRVMQWSKLY